MSTYNSIGQFIKEKRLSMGISQEELAGVLGVTPTTVSLYEAGKRKPDIESLKIIADKLKSSLAEILDIEVPQKNLDIALRANKLSLEDIENVKKYIQFIKYSRSGPNAEKDKQGYSKKINL